MTAFEQHVRRVRFVLVKPSLPANVGAAARALRTMGFARLVVVAPEVAAFREDAQALALATHGQGVLQAAEVQPSLAAALSGVQLAFALTGYAREFGPPLLDLREAAAQARAALDTAAAGDVAFVFGPERSGLLNEDVARCQACCAIAADPQHGSLNLAQAVQVTAYECRWALAGAAAAARSRFEEETPADLAAVERFYEHLERALGAIGFHDAATPRRLMARLRRLFGRARPTTVELDILRGICAAMEQPKRERAGRKGRAVPPA
jgi:tRNA/rRNA methyltransferase